jgi:nucleoside-diphosphate-sugar epimerase
MKIFLTGATGFIGSSLVPELLRAGHSVVGLSRSHAGAEALERAGAEVLRGDVNDPGCLRSGARTADGVIHAAFNHDFSNLQQHSENDRNVIAVLGEILLGSKRPFLVTSGTGLARRAGAEVPARETDGHLSSLEYPRAATEEAADALIAKGVNVRVIRLPQVHDTQRQGRITQHIQLARRTGRVAYVGEGRNRLAAVHISDAAKLYRLVLENGEAGACYHAVGEEGVALREIAGVIGEGLRLPVESITQQEATGYFGAMAALVTMDLAASSALTRRQLGWSPSGPDLLTDLRDMNYRIVQGEA